MSNGDVTGLTVAVVGLGYVGLPTALALSDAGATVVGIDSSPARLRAIARGAVDLLPLHHAQLACASAGDRFRLTPDPTAVRSADAVVICVPTPVDARREPDLTVLAAACASVVEHAVPGQLIVLTSTSYVGTTRDLLVEPLRARGLIVDEDVYVAFAPERIDPGNEHHTPERTPAWSAEPDRTAPARPPPCWHRPPPWSAPSPTPRPPRWPSSGRTPTAPSTSPWPTNWPTPATPSAWRRSR
ncbi:NAD(P)-binding domain-containing protein [Streptomyces parvulus]|uniref:NAD(P)-binding domain-containing protein n=1 Tax=Streptomyces parvulus TaxID=146923 RepID=UPI0037FB5047